MNSPYTDEELTAYLDGEVAADTAAKIAAAAQTDPVVAHRIEELAVDTDVLKAAFEPLLGVAQSRNLPHKLACAGSRHVANHPKRSSDLFIVGSYVAAIIIGVFLGWLFLTPKSDWRIEVAHYQALYIPDTLTPITPDKTRLQSEFSRASDVLGLVLQPSDFSNIDGLKLRRAQVLGYNGMPLVQIAFTLPDGTPIAFCILRQSGKASNTAPDVLVGLAAASWSTATHRFLAIGGDDVANILSLANKLESRI